MFQDVIKRYLQSTIPSWYELLEQNNYIMF